MSESDSSRIIWDIPTRILHWIIAVCIVLNLFILEEGETPHQWSGYIAVATVGFRFLWSFWGSAASRLTALPIHPRTLLAFARNGFADPSGTYSGHNPAAALVYLSIWVSILGLGISGWMMGLDAYWGEDWLENLHSDISIALQVFIGLHLIGVFLDSARYRRKTWAAMITGRKTAPFSHNEKK